MEKTIKRFALDLLEQRRCCPWAAKQSLAHQLRELESELEELRRAFKKKDWDNFVEEYGDVFWDLLMLGIIAEEKRIFRIKDAVASANAKLRRRKPWVFGGEKVRNRAEAVRRWNEIKALEKGAKIQKNAKTRK